MTYAGSATNRFISDSAFNRFYANASDRAFSHFQERMYHEAGTIKLQQKSTLSACLNKLPSEWINAMALNWQRPAQRLKRERIRDLSSFFLTAANLIDWPNALQGAAVRGTHSD